MNDAKYMTEPSRAAVRGPAMSCSGEFIIAKVHGEEEEVVVAQQQQQHKLRLIKNVQNVQLIKRSRLCKLPHAMAGLLAMVSTYFACQSLPIARTAGSSYI